MSRRAAAWILSFSLTGCMSAGGGPNSVGSTAHYGKSMGPPSVPGLQGPHGQPVSMAAPYTSAPPANANQARLMMAHSVPLDMVQMGGGAMGGAPPGAMGPMPMGPRGGFISPPGMPGYPGGPQGGGMPPMGGLSQASFKPGMMPPGMMPGMPGMPGVGGVMNANMPPGMSLPGGLQQAQFAGSPGVASHQRYASQRTQVKFNQPYGMKVAWFGYGADNKPMYSPVPIQTPGHYNFAQGSVYRLKLSNIDGRPGLELYPTMEVVGTSPQTEAFLSHNSVPIDFRPDDFKQVIDGNFVTKVIYLPHAQFQDIANVGTGEILSTQLEPGVDPIKEALQRGNILLIIRMGNILQELDHSPALNAPANATGPAAPTVPGLGSMGVPPGAHGHFQQPYFGKQGQPMFGPPAGLPAIPHPDGHGHPSAGPDPSLPTQAPVQQPGGFPISKAPAVPYGNPVPTTPPAPASPFGPMGAPPGGMPTFPNPAAPKVPGFAPPSAPAPQAPNVQPRIGVPMSSDTMAQPTPPPAFAPSVPMAPLAPILPQSPLSTDGLPTVPSIPPLPR